MGAWKDLNSQQKAAAEALFDALATSDALTARDADVPRRVGHAELYAYATRPERGLDDALRRALDESPSLRQDLTRMLDRRALCHFPRVAAASTGAVSKREGDGFSISFRESKAAAGQTYVIIAIDDPANARPQALFVCGEGHRYGKITLPEEQDGVIQLLLDSDSDELKALRDRRTEIFIR